MIRQRSLKSPIRASGIGLHGGRKVYISILPAPVNHGIVFRRVDLSPAVDIPASALLIGETTLCSTLVRDGVKVATVEHIMSALAGMGIDNVLVELSSPEIPIMDGSAAPFMYLLQSAGVVEQNAPRKFIRILQPVQVGEGDKYARLEPYEGFRLSFGIEFKHPAFKTSAQTATLEFTTANYIKEVSRARTFGFMREFEMMRSRNLALGASLDNAVALDDYRVVNPDGLRYDDEFVRHKILDAVGDLYLAGHPLLGAYSAYKSGHALNNQLACALLNDRKAWEFASFDDAAAAAPAVTSMRALAA
ncbi:UDP-3-O-acyl-N-acetylglucosamine deacetylase [Stagnimonas aquatica]|uniref:UDP-3-O-acyl-N-acetylglucosamine deacetylase n=1 Tax=Stagnimonas aquatica TaxID=2689987 RepID=A0A3N0VL23_9GAMM|nr:UDP-3-O-acyl-N-acetylglucosamine deacetylase [Stagnimonas aquatica]ROH93414.1 UDP-3-O-acyl-N-acetylglucosamine deacetylase [Stagnimonas aquatica]